MLDFNEMNLSEIEAAVDQLPHSEQKLLLKYLVSKLGLDSVDQSSALSSDDKRRLQKLESMRKRAATGIKGISFKELFDEVLN